MKSYVYEVTVSNVDTVTVGQFIVDRSELAYERGEPRTWTLFDSRTGGFCTGWDGVCLHRVCGPCRDLGVLREHKHSGRHGEAGSAPKMIPHRLST